MKKIIPILVLLAMLFASPAWAADSIIKGNITVTNYYGTNFYALTIPISVNGSAPVTARLDTGADITSFPDDYLRSFGFKPLSEQPNLALQASGGLSYYFYKIPYPVACQVDGKQIALGQGMMTVIGIVGLSFGALIGSDILSKDCLSLNGSSWTLTLADPNSVPLTMPQN